jgi:hypothetical protein
MVIYSLLVRRIPRPFSNSGIPVSECVSLLFFLLLCYLDRRINLQCLPRNDPEPFSLHTAYTHRRHSAYRYMPSFCPRYPLTASLVQRAASL